MRVLMLTPTPPYPPRSGGSLRAYGILHSLHAAGHQVTLLSFSEDAPRVPGSPLTELCEQIITVPPPARTKVDRLRHFLFAGTPDLVQRMASAPMREQLKHLAREGAFDVIQFEGLEMATYLPTAANAGTQARLIYDSFNAEYALQMNIARVDGVQLKRLPAALYSRVQAVRIFRFEKMICQTADAVIAVSPEDAALLRPLTSPMPVAIVPSGIFVDDYVSADSIDLRQPALVFTGKMDYRPNTDAALWFADAVLPRIHAAEPAAHWYVVGQQPSPAVEALNARPEITVTGAVPQVTPYLHQAAVYVAPLRMGSGTRLKLLEAMASGCAIVATSIAASGLDAETRAALLIADDETAFADAVIRLLRDETQRRTLGTQAQTVVRKHYDWAALSPRLMQVYKDIGVG